ncbi:hypothetical protein [Aquisalimonas sp.]|uniref:hypothetical protein n=1 Tax=Aquisalimonas sp. TaxID=1872621 RepID=UPI0025C4DE84|nr:hypothetical protein [Aquisalimonas sp.]
MSQRNGGISVARLAAGCQHDAVGMPELAEGLEAEHPVGGHLGAGSQSPLGPLAQRF